MSPLVALGLLGTTLSTTMMLPHVAHAVRARRPSGSALAWMVGASAAATWIAYGIVAGDLLVAAPCLVTFPANLALGLWCLHDARTARTAAVVALRTPADLDALYRAKAAHPAGRGRETRVSAA